MKNLFLKIQRVLQIIYKTPRLLLIFLIALTLVTAVLFQQSLEIAVLRLLFVYFSFKVTFYLMENNPIYKKGISVESTELEKGYSSRTILSEQNFLSKWIDSWWRETNVSLDECKLFIFGSETDLLKSALFVFLQMQQIFLV